MRAMRTSGGRCGGLLIVGLAVAACSGGADASGGTQEDAPTAPRAGAELFAETFDDDSNRWALPPNDQASTEVAGGDFVWTGKAPGLKMHMIAGTQGDQFDQGTLDDMRSVVVRATATPDRGAAAIGVFCREVRDTDADFQWYEFVARDGYAAIRLADSAGNLDVLAETKRAEVPPGEPAVIEGACDGTGGSARLWLTLNEQQLLFARHDGPLGNGVAGLQAYGGPAGSAGDRFLIHWHDFTVHAAG